MGSSNSGGNVGATRGSFDRGYNGGAPYKRIIGDNIESLRVKYSYTDGYFGVRSGNSRVRLIESDSPRDEAKTFYEKASYGGEEKPMPNGQGVLSKMADGTVVSMREVSSSDGSPAVDINITKSVDSSGIKSQKIHFVKKNGESR